MVEPADEDDFLLPLPVRAVPGIGPATAAALERLDVRTVADLRRQPLDILTMTVGESSGVNLFRLARGIDPRPVAPGAERKSVGAERTFAEDIFGPDLVAAAIDRVTDEALRRLGAHGGGARTVVAKVRFADFTTLTRSVTLPQPSAEPAELRAAAHQAARAAGISDSVRLLGVSFHNLSAHAQLTLPWGDEEPAPVVVDEPVDAADPRPGSSLLTEENARPGLDVEHPTLGRGWVVHVRGRQATVRFESVDTPPARSQVVDLTTDPLRAGAAARPDGSQPDLTSARTRSTSSGHARSGGTPCPASGITRSSARGISRASASPCASGNSGSSAPCTTRVGAVTSPRPVPPGRAGVDEVRVGGAGPQVACAVDRAPRDLPLQRLVEAAALERPLELR